MPADYTGNPGSVQNPHDIPTISCPVDGDPRNAASVNTPLQKLADFVAYLQRNAALLQAANTFLASQTIQGAAGIKWTGTTMADNGANPRSTLPMVNELCAKNICKAWGVVSFLGSGPTIMDGLNVASARMLDDYTLRVNFATPFASGNYALLATDSRYQPNNSAVFTIVMERMPEYFTMRRDYIDNIDHSYNRLALFGNAMDFGFCAFGRQDT